MVKENNNSINGDIERFNSEILTQCVQRRKDWMHLVTHFLAYLMVVIFLILVLFDFLFRHLQESSIPNYFISMVSTIIGFYFGDKLSKSNR